MEEDVMLLFVSNYSVCWHCNVYICAIFHIHPNKLTYVRNSCLFRFLFYLPSLKLEALTLFSLSSWLVLTIKSNNLKKYCRNIFSIFIFVSLNFFIRKFELFSRVFHKGMSFHFCSFLVWALFDNSTIHLSFIFKTDSHSNLMRTAAYFFYFVVSTQVFLLSEFDLSKAFCL